MEKQNWLWGRRVYQPSRGKKVQEGKQDRTDKAVSGYEGEHLGRLAGIWCVLGVGEGRGCP